ncbi:MAG: 16S rRNA pseudouridine(516) synthase [Ruminococcaceae bacterium]|nr:16S rRNA pseudouridine(516) synthase [Oscillospiraceae bacterium]MBE7017459.1 16S rRNA pseudouridine(516) synthase [Oscillospiraceae bacterium]
MALIRLDKLIADSGRASRREAKDLVKAGRVRVDNIIAYSAEMKVDADSVVVYIDGESLDYRKNRYIMMNKPNGVLSATEDSQQKTVIDLLPENLRKQEFFPVGRLDKDTTGLLLLTNDGVFSHSIISPKRHIAKVYRAAVTGVLDASDIAAFEEGIVLSDGTKCMSAHLEIDRPSVGLATVYEGKYHQVKRMFASRGKHVTALHRLSIGGLSLDPNLKSGEFKELDEDEIKKIFE